MLRWRPQRCQGEGVSPMRRLIGIDTIETDELARLLGVVRGLVAAR